MDTATNAFIITENEALGLLSQGRQDQNDHYCQEKWFDIYGNYSYPTDYVLPEPNIASATQEGSLAFVASHDVLLPR